MEQQSDGEEQQQYEQLNLDDLIDLDYEVHLFYAIVWALSLKLSLRAGPFANRFYQPQPIASIFTFRHATVGSYWQPMGAAAPVA